MGEDTVPNQTPRRTEVDDGDNNRHITDAAFGHWTFRWLLMLAIFALSTAAFSSYAGASPPATADAEPVTMRTA